MLPSLFALQQNLRFRADYAEKIGNGKHIFDAGRVLSTCVVENAMNRIKDLNRTELAW
jgi:hypothetical protein